jgi:hypothetical protein
MIGIIIKLCGCYYMQISYKFAIRNSTLNKTSNRIWVGVLTATPYDNIWVNQMRQVRQTCLCNYLLMLRLIPAYSSRGKRRPHSITPHLTSWSTLSN